MQRVFQDQLVGCERGLLCRWLAVALPELVPRNHPQDPVPTIHRQPRQQPTLVRLSCEQHRERRQLGRRCAPCVGHGAPISEVRDHRQVRVLPLLVERDFVKGGDEMVVVLRLAVAHVTGWGDAYCCTLCRRGICPCSPSPANIFTYLFRMLSRSHFPYAYTSACIFNKNTILFANISIIRKTP